MTTRLDTPVEARGSRVVSVRLSDTDHALLRIVAAAQDQSMASYVEDAIRERLRDGFGEVQAQVAMISDRLDEPRPRRSR
ncbi:MAG TPA: hypothetical protein VGO60_13505 [Iamia sp.]|jgi:hypothetical protein|nr:hypothetical protein [Iamia sp.]